MAYPASRASPARPSVELVSRPAVDDSVEDGETVEGLMAKLAIERKVQYGAEKMLDVIEKSAGDPEGSEQAKIKGNITAQLEAANEHIKALEAKLERLRGTPQRHRRRPQPRLNGYASTSSLGQPLSSSHSSSTLLSASGRPTLPHKRSNLTPDREADRDVEKDRDGYFTPTRPPPSRGTSSSQASGSSRPRSRSAGEDSLDLGSERGLSRLGWDPRLGSPGGQQQIPDDENTAVLVETARLVLRRLRDVGRGKGKNSEREAKDEMWECMNKLADMLKKTGGLKSRLDVDEVLQATLPWLGDSSNPRRRAAGYRLLRHMLDRPAWGRMLTAGLEWLIIRSFTRDAKAVHEREQVLRLLRAVVLLPPSPSPERRPASSPISSRSRSRHTSADKLSEPIANMLENRVALTDGLVRAVVSAAENPDDAMRTVCMETLVEIGVLDIRCLIQSNALRTVLLAFKDGPFELGPAITGLLLYLVNQPSTRRHLLPGADLEAVLVGLTEAYVRVPTRQQARHLENLKSCVTNIGMLLASWPGLLYMCMDNCRAIKSLISSLHVPNADMRDALMNLFFAALRIKTPTWANAFLDGKRLTVYNRTQEATNQHLHGDGNEEEEFHNLNLVDHFIALLLAIFIESGLIEALIAVIGEDGSTLNRKATLLLGEILQMANKVLPLKFAAQLQSLPRLFAEATDFTNQAERMAALAALSSIDSMNRNQTKQAKITAKENTITTSAQQDTIQRGQRQVQSVKLRLGLQVDDKQFQQMIVDSGLLLHRDHTKWNYDLIVDLVEGPLLNPKRLDEAIKATKLVRRLFSFFHPYNNRFSIVKRTRPNHKWVKLGCSMLSTMLSNPEGIRFIAEDKLLRQMMECFNELDQYVGQPSAQPVFARDRLQNTLTYGYFEFIGTLSRHREGMKLLEKFKFFTCFYHLSEQRSRDDIIRIIIECFDYTLDAHPRIVLSKALTSSYMETRLFATHHLGRLLQEYPSLLDWGLQLMITQLYDTAMEVCDVSVMYLEEACRDPMCLEKVVQLRPTLEHLGDVGHPLFMRFVSTSVGFSYLHQAQYIDRELDHWLLERNLLYVIEAETFVSKTVRPYTSDKVEDYWVYDGPAPTHFLGELTKTPEGCQLLKGKGIVPEYAEIVRLHGMESEDQAVMTNVKSVLWALGNIGATEGGLPFLEEEEIIEDIIEIAEQSPVLTMKGTCFFVIGLISSTGMGAEILEEFGWISTRTPLGLTTGLCLPNDILHVATIEAWDRPDLSPTCPPLTTLTGLEAEIMTSIANLSNYVLAAGAMNNLKRIRTRHPRYFSSITLLHRALRSISTNHYQAPVRRFILDLFEINLEPETLTQLAHIDAMAWKSALNSDTSTSAYARRSTNGNAIGSGASLGSRGSRENSGGERERGYRAGAAEPEEPIADKESRRKRSRSSPGPMKNTLLSSSANAVNHFYPSEEDAGSLAEGELTARVGQKRTSVSERKRGMTIGDSRGSGITTSSGNEDWNGQTTFPIPGPFSLGPILGDTVFVSKDNQEEDDDVGLGATKTKTNAIRGDEDQVDGQSQDAETDADDKFFEFDVRSNQDHHSPRQNQRPRPSIDSSFTQDSMEGQEEVRGSGQGRHRAKRCVKGFGAGVISPPSTDALHSEVESLTKSSS